MTSDELPALRPDEVADRLLSIVSERTGYPRETLDLNADLDTLGIDSLKRLEILSEFSASSLRLRKNEGWLEEMIGVRTLQGIIDRTFQGIKDLRTEYRADVPLDIRASDVMAPDIRHALDRPFTVVGPDQPLVDEAIRLATMGPAYKPAPGRLAAPVPAERETTRGDLKPRRSPEVELVLKAFEIIGSPQRLAKWMRTPLVALHGKAPYSLLGSEEGRKEVDTVLGRIEHGIY